MGEIIVSIMSQTSNQAQ